MKKIFPLLEILLIFAIYLVTSLCSAQEYVKVNNKYVLKWAKVTTNLEGNEVKCRYEVRVWPNIKNNVSTTWHNGEFTWVYFRNVLREGNGKYVIETRAVDVKNCDSHSTWNKLFVDYRNNFIRID